MDTSQLQSYINKINEISNIDLTGYTKQQKQDFNILQIEEYASALSDVEAKQVALLLSTQDVSNAQIQQTLSAQGLTATAQYQAMAEAGLLKSKQTLNNIEIQNNITKILSKQMSEADAKAKAGEAMASMQLSAVIEGEEAQTVRLTAAKLHRAVTENILTKAQEQELAMTLGIAVAQESQIAGTMPKWIAQIKAMAIATWKQVAATAAWLATNPAAWCVAAGAALFAVYKVWEAGNVTLEEAKEKYDETASAVESVTSELKNVNSQIDDLLAKDTPTITDENDLKRLKQENTELENRLKILEAQKELDAQTLNKKIEKEYKKKFTDNSTGMTITNEDGSMEYLSGEDYIKNRITYAKELINSGRELTEEETQNLNEVRQYLMEEGSIISDTIDGYTAITSEQKEQKKNWEDIISDIAYIAEMGNMPEVTERLKEKFAYKTDQEGQKTTDTAITNWIETLSNEDRRIMVTCDLENASLNELKQYLTEQKDALEKELTVSPTLPEFQDPEKAKELSAFISDAAKKLKPQTISETVVQFDSQFVPLFRSLKSAYQDVFTLDDNGRELFSLENIDLSVLGTMRSELDKLNDDDDLGISVDYSSFENLSKILADTESSEQQVRDAVNRFASDLLNSLTPALLKSSNENLQLISALLKSIGIINAEEMVISSAGYSYQQYNAAKQECADASFNLENATQDQINKFVDEQISAGMLTQALTELEWAKAMAGSTKVDTQEDVDRLLSLARAAGISLNSLAQLEKFKTDLEKENDPKTRQWIIKSINEYVKSLSQEIQHTQADFSPKEEPKTTSSASGAGKDSHLEEYRQKLEELQTMLDRELINEKEFYDQSNTLLNDYLKDTPAHLQKYANEISGAEKTLRGNWISSFGYEKSQLEKDLSDSTLVQWQYYERLSELAELYYNTEGASYGKFADEYEEITQEIKDGQEKLWDDIFSEVNSQIDGLQSACETVRDAVAEYSENGSLSIDTMQKLIALEPQYMAMLFDENGQLQLNAQAYERLAKTKLEELKIDLAGQALNTINSLQSEAQAVEMLTGKYAELRDTGAGAIEQQLQDAVAEAYGRGEQQGKAAEMVLQAYVNQKKVLDAADLSSLSITAEQKDSDADRFLKTFDWIGTLLKKISDSTSKLIDKADRFYNWQKKNSMINRAVKSASREISQNELAYQTYMKKANSVGLGLNYVRKVQDGTLSVEDVTDENTANKIEKYQEWYDKAQACLDTVEDLYDRQRDLIRQKLDNVLDYYSSMDSYLSSITSKIESIISLNDGMGKRTSLTELVEQFAAVSDRLENAKAKNTAAAGITDQKTQEDSFGGSKKVAEANERDRKELADTIQTEIDDLDVKKTGNYKKLRDKIADTQSEIDRYRNNGWDKSKAKSYEKLQKELKDYYDLQKALDENATSDTIANYEKIYTKYQKLQNKINSGKTLSESEQKRYDSYAGQLDGLKARGQSALDSLRTELAETEGTAPKQSEAERIQGEIDGIQSDLEDTATYQNLKRNIEVTESSLAELDEAGYDNLPQKQKKAYDKMKKQLGDYYAQKKALDEGATASNIAEYNKTYLEWKKLQDKLDNGKNLTQSQWKQYNNYTKQLENFRNEKSDTMDGLKAALEEAKNPSDRLEQIEKTFEESSKGIRDSYLGQIDGINGEAENSQQYQNLKAKAQNLEQKKKDKGLSPSEQAKLDKYNAELNALETGATGANIKDYMKTWESWYTLEQKLEKNGKLSDSDAKKYDGYKAKLDAWNDEKQTQINDLLSLMEDDLEQLKMTYSENVSEAESEINDYYANLYSLAKQIAEYNVSSLQTQLAYLESCISYYKELVSLYDSFSGDKLVKILKDLGEISAGDEISRRQDLYSGYLDKLQEKYDTTLSQINEYSQLLKALETGDFESSMGIFSKAMEDYRAEGNTEMADKMQSVLDLLNERASGADDWDEYADEWKNEWEEALSSVKQDLIGTAEEIQEINDALREIRFEHITDAIAELDRASGMLSSIESLIQDDWLFEPDGSLSEYGRAKAALLVSQLEDAQAQADAYLNLYNEIQDSKDTYASDKEYREASNDALQNYYDSLNSAASLENSITDLMKKNAEAEINSLKDVIEARKQALQSKKEYYDYDKSIKNSQKEIDSLKAQIDALENLSDATDAATKAKLAQLKAELTEKEDALQETKDEHTFNLQIDALDEFSNSLTDALDSSAKSVEEILKEQKEIVESAKELSKASADSTNKTLDLLTSFYSGMGISIDGTDLTHSEPITTDSIHSDTAPNAIVINTGTNPQNSAIVSGINDASSKIDNLREALSSHNHEAVTAIQENTNTISNISQAINDSSNKATDAIGKTANVAEQFRQEAAAKFAALISNEQFVRTFDPSIFGLANTFIPQISDNLNQLNNCINTREETPPMVNNIHYDSLLTINGNVDKDAAKLLPMELERNYQYMSKRLYEDLSKLGSISKVIR